MGINKNQIGQNLLGAMQYAKATNTKQKDEFLSKNDADESIQYLELNNNNDLAGIEVEKSLFDNNIDKKILSQDLGVYTSIIHYSNQDIMADNLVLESANGTNGYTWTFDYKRNEDGSRTVTKYTYNPDHQLVSKEVLTKPKSKEEYQYTEDGELLRTYTYTYNEDGSYTKSGLNHKTGKTTIREYNANNQLMSYEVTSDPKSKREYTYNDDGKLIQETFVRPIDGEDVQTTYVYTYNEDGSYAKTGLNHKTGKTTVREYNANDQLMSFEVTSEPKSREEYQYDNDGNLLRTYTYKYNDDGSYIKSGINHATGKQAIYTYNANNQLMSYEVTSDPKSREEYTYYDDGRLKQTNSTSIENEKEVQRTYDYTYNDDGSYTKSGINHTTGKQAIYTYNANDQLIRKEVITFPKSLEIYNDKGLLTRKEVTKENGDKKIINYTKYEGDYPKEYNIESYFANGVHTKSYITQRKLQKSDGNYIESTKNYQLIPKADGTFEERLIFELDTGDVKDADGVVHEGTHRMFYLYDENGKLIKTEYTENYNRPEQEGKPIRTNDFFQLQSKLVTTYDPDTGLKTSEITYDENYITTTYFDSDGKTVKDVKKETYKDNSYANHNINNVSREDFLAEAAKYTGLKSADGSYSIFGTNGSHCASFVTFIMYELGFDMNAVNIRTTYGIRDQAKNEGRYIDVNNVFDLLNKDVPGEEVIKPGDIFTITKGKPGSGSHSVIVRSVKYDSEKNQIVLEMQENYSNSVEYVLTQNPDGTLVLDSNAGVKYVGTAAEIGFSDYISSPEEIAKKNEKLGLYQDTV